MTRADLIRALTAAIEERALGKLSAYEAEWNAETIVDAITDLSLGVVPYECQPIILAAGWGAINAGRTRPVDMAPGPALREAWPAMVEVADLARCGSETTA